jgi:hypothetical protein
MGQALSDLGIAKKTDLTTYASKTDLTNLNTDIQTKTLWCADGSLCNVPGKTLNFSDGTSVVIGDKLNINSKTPVHFNIKDTEILWMNEFGVNTNKDLIVKGVVDASGFRVNGVALTAVKGDTGPQGIKGDTGPQGIKGDTGPAGNYQNTYDFILGSFNTVERGDSKGSRALVKEKGDGTTSKLIINWGNDFSGGIDMNASGGLRINGPGRINGGTKDVLKWGSDGTVFMDKICNVAGTRCIDLSNTNGINFTNNLGGQLRFQDDANLVQMSKTGTVNIAFNKLDGNFGN